MSDLGPCLSDRAREPRRRPDPGPQPCAGFGRDHRHRRYRWLQGHGRDEVRQARLGLGRARASAAGPRGRGRLCPTWCGSQAEWRLRRSGWCGWSRTCKPVLRRAGQGTIPVGDPGPHQPGRQHVKPTGRVAGHEQPLTGANTHEPADLRARRDTGEVGTGEQVARPDCVFGVLPHAPSRSNNPRWRPGRRQDKVVRSGAVADAAGFAGWRSGKRSGPGKGKGPPRGDGPSQSVSDLFRYRAC